MRRRAFLAWLLLFASAALPAAAQEYYDIDVDLPQYPDMEPIPDSPAYYAPAVDSNYFFYDGLYWDYAGDNWYASSWYNGPWQSVDPVYVPTYVLWIPVRYYHRPPPFFRGWHRDRPPHWTEHWGRGWQDRHNAVFANLAPASARAPLPTYQRQFTRGNYPRAPQQQAAIHASNYHHRPSVNPLERGRSHPPTGNAKP